MHLDPEMRQSVARRSRGSDRYRSQAARASARVPDGRVTTLEVFENDNRILSAERI